MKKKKVIIGQNFLEKTPKRADLRWSSNDEGIITLEVDNKGWVNWIAQKFFRRPKTSYIHLDKFGSFVWEIIDGESNLLVLGEKVKETFGEEANPLYERLAQYFRILESYHFINWVE